MSAVLSEQNNTTTYVVNASTLLCLQQNDTWWTVKHLPKVDKWKTNTLGQFLLKIRTFQSLEDEEISRKTYDARTHERTKTFLSKL